MQSIYEQFGGTYSEVDGYGIPNLVPPAEKEDAVIGFWGQRHLRYLQRHRRVLYTNLLTSGRLSDYLAELNREAEELFFRLVKQMAEQQGITETQKASDQMAWVGAMKNIRSCAKEVVFNDLTYR